MGEPHKHAEIIKAYADGHAIQFRKLPTDTWEDAQADDDTAPAFSKNYEYRIKPEPPKYPWTRLTSDDMAEIARNTPGNWMDSYYAIANAAIARAIEDEDVVPAAMLEKVGIAVTQWHQENLRKRGTRVICDCPSAAELSEIIASVKEGK